MAKRWKARLTNQDPIQNNQSPRPLKMIEYSITPYSVIQTYQHTQYQTKKTVMTKDEYEAYLVLAANRGYKLGARIETNYQGVGTITDIKIIKDSIDIWGEKPGPDCFLITLDSSIAKIQNTCGYNESELKLI